MVEYYNDKPPILIETKNDEIKDNFFCMKCGNNPITKNCKVCNQRIGHCPTCGNLFECWCRNK